MEWSLTTNTMDSGEQKDPAFLNNFWVTQISAYANYNNSVGYFFWTLKMGANKYHDNYFINFDLLSMIEQKILTPIAQVDITTLCPASKLSHCPYFNVSTVNSTSNCAWV